MTTHEYVLPILSALGDPDKLDWQVKSYENEFGVPGKYVGFRYGGQHHFISVHNCQTSFSPTELAHALSGIEVIKDIRRGVYTNKVGVPGLYATARSTRSFDESLDHWFMIRRSAERDPSLLAIRRRLLLIDPTLSPLDIWSCPEERL